MKKSFITSKIEISLQTRVHSPHKRHKRKVLPEPLILTRTCNVQDLEKANNKDVERYNIQ